MMLRQDVDPEVQNVRLAMQGDADARNRLFEFIYARILRYHRKLAGGNESLAEEWTQETLIRLIRSFDQLRDPEGFVPWAFRIATNVSRDTYRARATIATDNADVAVGDGRADEGEDLGRRVLALLERLPDPYRSVLTLRYLEGMAYETMAEVLGTPVPTLRSQLARGRQMIRRRLGR